MYGCNVVVCIHGRITAYNSGLQMLINYQTLNVFIKFIAWELFSVLGEKFSVRIATAIAPPPPPVAAAMTVPHQ